MSIRANLGLINICVSFLIFIVLYYRQNTPVETTFKASVPVKTIASGSVIFYNRIPKTGSTTFTNALAYDLSESNGFRAIHLNLTRNRYMVNVLDQENIIRNISTWAAVTPAFYHGHVVFLDFTRFGYPNPIYINLVREPFERFLSYYYFLRYGDNYRVGLKRKKAGNNQTFDDCLQQNGKDCDPKLMWLQIPYFCGTAGFCSDIGSERALETAKWNLLNRYLVVGLTERMEDMILVLQHLLPTFFHGAYDHFRALNDKRSHLRYTQKKIPPSPETINKIKENKIYLMEREFYDFASKEFDTMFKRIFDKESGQVLENQFHYEKIRPQL